LYVDGCQPKPQASATESAEKAVLELTRAEHNAFKMKKPKNDERIAIKASG
jgi:hypothetical protein